MPNEVVRIRRALLTVSDKERVAELAQALHKSGAEIVATGKTAQVIAAAGVPVTPIEKVSGSPEAFQGRMKTLSFPVCSGILYRRGDASDEADLKKLSIQPIDCVVVNFYPFEKAAEREGITRAELIEEVDIGGPTLVRAAAKNAPDVLVLTSPGQYGRVIEELSTLKGVRAETAHACAAAAWDRILEYDLAIDKKIGTPGVLGKAGEHVKRALRYGENPHQTGELEIFPDSPIAWDEPLTATEISYNNVLDLSAAYGLACDLGELAPASHGVVIIKHNNPCGVATAPSQLLALQQAWEGDPVSAFGGVLAFTTPLEEDTATWLASRFVELVAAPGLERDGVAMKILAAKRKNLKALAIRRFGGVPDDTVVRVPGAVLRQRSDKGLGETLKSVTKAAFPPEREKLAHFGIAVCRALKSNAIALVRETREGGYQLVGAGQGQPNRIEALQALAVPRARKVLGETGGQMVGSDLLGDCVMVSDAFFPFRDTVDACNEAGIRAIVQPGGSIKDQDSIGACDEHGIAMAFTGVRHFRH